MKAQPALSVFHGWIDLLSIRVGGYQEGYQIVLTAYSLELIILRSGEPQLPVF